MSNRQVAHGGAPEARSGGGQPPDKQELGTAKLALPAQPEPRVAEKLFTSEREDPRSGIAAELAGITAEGRLRQRPVIDSACDRTIVLVDGKRKRLINWAANDYLGASQELIVRNGAFRALRSYGAGSGSARLLAGGLRLHRQFEQRIAKFLGTQDALLTSTGFQANLAAVVALAGDPQDAIVLENLISKYLFNQAEKESAAKAEAATPQPEAQK